MDILYLDATGKGIDKHLPIYTSILENKKKNNNESEDNNNNSSESEKIINQYNQLFSFMEGSLAATIIKDNPTSIVESDK